MTNTTNPSLGKGIYGHQADDLRDLPTQAVGQADDLKIDTGLMRVWLCRCGVADGMPHDDMVTVELLTGDGSWVTKAEYPG